MALYTSWIIDAHQLRVFIHNRIICIFCSCAANCVPGDFIPHERLRLDIPPGVDNSGLNLWALVEAPAEFPGIDWTTDILVANEDALEVHPNVFTVSILNTVNN